MSDATVYSRFSNPGAEYRSVPFWAWNDALSIEELKWQIRNMKEHGLGGFFMHSRDGLETTYMGPEWMRAVHAAVAEAGKVGMNAWLYDEDRWPSGFAGGAVPAKGEAYQQKYLVKRVHRKAYRPTGEEFAAFIVRLDGRKLRSARRI